VSPWEAALLGVVQGLTEFLPISSSGHLVLAGHLLGLDLPGVVFEVVVHLATLCAVLWVYRSRVAALAGGALRGERAAWEYLGLLALATVPAGLAGVLGRDFFEGMFDRPLSAAAFLVVTGFLVWSIRYTAPRAGRERPTPRTAGWVGVAQALAILPGISRSGTTMAVGVWKGVDAVRMAEFSFLLSVPAILGAGVLQIGAIRATDPAGAIPLAAGFVAALVTGVAAIRLFVRTLERRTFHWFALYCWVVGAGYLIAAAVWPGLRG
jgi:undecaprenyl-diphosphatase